MDSGILIAVPIPEDKSLDSHLVEGVIKEALDDAR